ncbi:MAG: hypothetical protein ACI4B5_02655 [Bacteroidaceae bacterium]
MRKMFGLALLAMAGVMFTACSDDDDNGGGDSSSEGAAFGIPASVVDGVRVSSIEGDNPMTVTYNGDGTIAKVVYADEEYEFEYDEVTRADQPASRKLLRIITSYTYDDEYIHESEKTIGSGFQFDKNNFLIRYTEEQISSYSCQYGSQSLSSTERYVYNCSLNYNAKGRLLSNSITGNWEDVTIENGVKETEKGSDKVTVKYDYSGDVLTKVGFGTGENSFSWSFGYDSTSPSNYYNIFTPNLAVGVSVFSRILYILATQGYLGNASATLPSTMTSKSIEEDNDGEDYVEDNTYNIFYTMWDNTQKVRTVETWCGGIPYGVVKFDYSIYTE